MEEPTLTTEKSHFELENMVESVENIGDSNDSGDFVESDPPKKKRGNPAFVQGNTIGKKGGRPKGSRNKTNLLREQLEEIRWSPLDDLYKFMKKQYWSQTDNQKVKILKDLVLGSTAREKVSENHSTEDKTITIQLGYAPMDGNILENAQREFGIIEGEVIEDEMCRLPKHDDDEED